jgi:hypothetical protein
MSNSYPVGSHGLANASADGRVPAANENSLGGSRDANTGNRTHLLERRWQIVAHFHTDKGIERAICTVAAPNPIAAIDELHVDWFCISELYALSVTPAPLEVN